MVLCESIIAYDATINAETDTLEVLSPTSLTIRDAAYGRARITHAMALTSTNDVQVVRVVPSGYKDSAGFEIPCKMIYGNTSTFDLENAWLEEPIPVPNNSTLVIYATSETAANTVVLVWLVVEYDGAGEYQEIMPAGGCTVREINAGGALTSIVAAAGTSITDLQAGRRYQIAGFSGVGIQGQTAGAVGPAFVKFQGPAEFHGMEYWLPLPNSGSYVAGSQGCGFLDLKYCGLKMPPFSAPNTLVPWFLDYTAEQPEARMLLNVDSVY